jgi:putative transcriptional regulator
MIKVNLQQMMLDASAKQGEVITIEDVAKGTGIARNTLSRIKNKPGHSTSTDVINKLCNYFECGVEEIVSYRPD